MDIETERALQALDVRLRAMLPEEYQESYEDVQPVSMGSAGLKFDAEGKVAWNEIWGSFCDLAMAGGPPHKGALLEPGSATVIAAQPGVYAHVTEEICRGVIMASGLAAEPASAPGWVRVECYSEVMAAWLLRAIVMENVSVRREGTMLDLPAAPHFRLEKEIKNVVTVIAKTAHYWLEHMSRLQQRGIASLFAQLAEESPLIEPAFSADSPDGSQRDDERATSARMAEEIRRRAGLPASSHAYAGWLGIECPTVRAAVWMMRALVVTNVLSRREGTTLFVPVNTTSDPDGSRVVESVLRVHGLAVAKRML